MNPSHVKGRRRGSKSGASLSGESDQETTASGNAPPFLPLEATTEKPLHPAVAFVRNTQITFQKYLSHCNGKKVVSSIMFGIIGLVIWDAVFTDPDNRMLRPDFADTFLHWVENNPVKGILAFLFVIAVAVILMIPIGTPLTLGCGYIYKATYGWTWGLTLATAVSMGGSALGAVACFLLGRYLMRDQVRLWIRKYPLFDAIDVAAAEHGLRIMAMLYLTPILPLGPVSYMCGTTSMALRSFVLAKVASLPLMLLYVFIGASTGHLLSTDSKAASDEVKSIEENETLIVSGILLSFLMIGGITHFIKKELDKILDKQSKERKDLGDGTGDGASEEAALEMGLTPKEKKTRQRRPQ